MVQKKNKKINLHLGCGKRNIPNFINIDKSSFKHIHFKKSVDNLKIFKNNSVDMIYASHVLEYFDIHELKKVLKEWKRVLKKDGLLRISVPNFQSLIKVYKKTNNIENIIGPLFGRMKSGKNTIYHKYVHDYKSLNKILKSLNFKKIKKFNWRKTFHAKYDDHSQAYFPHMSKTNGIMISLNIDAKK
jgi:predicted SAM-dependent methyltransferase|tara:strand:+ start:940 stop:1500 length:561 start_codon:yes stop_codon:yes gene_type:complete